MNSKALTSTFTSAIRQLAILANITLDAKMKVPYPLIFCLMCLTSAEAQVGKSTWLAGGMGTYSNSRNNDGENYLRSRMNLQIAPNLGYFFADQAVAGIRLAYTNERTAAQSAAPSGEYVAVERSFTGGPFVRYYFLPSERILNFLVEGNYQFGSQTGGAAATRELIQFGTITKNSFTALAGPTIFFNSSVGLELLIGYTHSRYRENNDREGVFQASIGFQFYLERD